MVNLKQAEEAAATLGVVLLDLTDEQVTAAFRIASRECHPDSQKPDLERWAAISAARATLGQWLATIGQGSAAAEAPGAKGDCRACAGTGRIQKRRGFGLGAPVQCVLCGGTGYKEGW